MTRPLDPEVLLRESAWLRALARSLVGDPNLADDLVQDAWVAALEHPLSARAEIGPRAWLATVTRNLARQRGRGAAGARARERAVARPEALPSTSESVERVAAQRELVDAVLALDSVERELVVLRYFEGLPPREIAGRLGLTGPAVRSRLARALGRLRERLDRRFEGGRVAWAALLVPAGAGEPRPTSRSTPAPLLLAGLGATAIAVLVGVKTLGTAGESAAEAPLELAAAAVAPSVVDGESNAPAAPASEPEAEPRREAVEASVAPTSAPAAGAGETWTLVARFVDENGVALRGVRLSFVVGRDLRAGESDATGALRIERAWPVDPNELAGNGQLWVTAGGHALATQSWYLRPIGPGEQNLGEIRMVPGGTLVGRVVGADGRTPMWVTAIGGYAPETDAGLDELRTFGANVLGLGARFQVRGSAAADGSFRMEGVLATSVRVIATQLGRLGALSPPFPLGAGQRVDVGALVLEEPGPENLVAGVVLDSAGAPVVGAHIEYGEGDPAREQGHYGTSDESGRFALIVPRGRKYGLLFARDQSKRDPLLLTDVVAGTVDLVVRFPSERWITLAARAADGTPVPAKSALLWDTHDAWLNPTTEVEPDGRVRLRLPTVPFHVRLDTGGWKGEPQGPLDPAALGAELVFPVTRASGLAGRVLADGAPVAGARVHAHRASEGGPRISDDGFHARVESYPIGDTETDAEGRFRITYTVSGALTLHAELDGWARAELGPIELVEGVEQDGLELVLERGGALEGRLLVAEGVQLYGKIVGVGSGDAHVATQRLGADGRYRFERLRPGEVQVLTCDPQTLERLEGGSYMYADPDEPVLWSTSVRAGEVTRFDLDQRDRIPSRLLGELRFDGRAPSGWSANLIDGEGDVAHERLSGDGRFELRTIRPGTKWLTFVGRAGTADVRFSQKLELAPRDNAWTRDFPTGTVTLANVPAFERRKKGSEGAPAYCLAWRDDPALVWYGSIYDPPEVAGGTLTFPGVPAGHVQLLACPEDVHRGSPDARWPVVRELELVAGGHAQVTLP